MEVSEERECCDHKSIVDNKNKLVQRTNRNSKLTGWNFPNRFERAFFTLFENYFDSLEMLLKIVEQTNNPDSENIQ